MNLEPIIRKTFFRGVIGLFALAASSSFWVSCTEDNAPAEIIDPSAPHPASMFLSLNISVPVEGATRTRSFTEDNGDSSDDVILGTTAESLIHSATLYFVDKQSGQIALQLEARRDIEAPDEDGNTVLYAEIEDITTLTASQIAGHTFYIYIVANSGEASFLHNFSDTGAGNVLRPENAVFNVSNFSGPVGLFPSGGKTMPLVNNDYSLEVTIPSDADPDVLISKVMGLFSDVHDNEAHWKINENRAIQLERAVARLEYHDLEGRVSSSDTPTGTAASRDNKDLPPNTYWVGSSMNVCLRLASLQPFNINRQAYLFRHGATGTTTAAAGQSTIFVTENGGGSSYNWITNPDWSLSGTSWSKPEVSSSGYLNPISVSETDYSVSGSDGLVTVETLETASNGQDSFHPFAYVMENTLPSVSLMANYSASGSDLVPLVTKYATGVAFRFLVLKNQTDPVTYDPDKSGFPSEFDWSIETGETDHLQITDSETGQWVDIPPTVETDANGTSVKHYYLTYIAMMVHNDPQDAGYDPSADKFAPMYYGVVRNNSYQITVRSITGLPLPRDPKTIFLQIDCKVADWKKRLDDNVILY